MELKQILHLFLDTGIIQRVCCLLFTILKFCFSRFCKWWSVFLGLVDDFSRFLWFGFLCFRGLFFSVFVVCFSRVSWFVSRVWESFYVIIGKHMDRFGSALVNLADLVLSFTCIIPRQYFSKIRHHLYIRHY